MQRNSTTKRTAFLMAAILGAAMATGCANWSDRGRSMGAGASAGPGTVTPSGTTGPSGSGGAAGSTGSGAGTGASGTR
jgi:hypothetical protein